ncbi:MAG TPA: two-component system response regulator [Rhodospirillaceae bacterium]|jgi:two-component system chemotaxis response regulator CheY|nr:two-component system response regulator [Rhodospirillaceae bacterium]MAX62090.1 two-component system response regulator [Rhodospirillaceae bacterium]MBB58060.1 two-component system response regulator [Rhodospirillaceae bacterium]HAE00044.1 two-component system response regulator [Rhodospirillaceae bacterium]HAJ22905.1 two-component system response regulator [Rhodospirillaceae bacterium]|tara:strand:- start:1332 stop:1718 length:387 start_codon:yes stop_codon:yes gene_type:complete
MAVRFDINILVVDDRPTMVRILCHMLRELQFTHIDDATDGGDALAKLAHKDYGLVISDWTMKPMNGLDLLRAMRADETWCETPFLMMTPENKTENVIAARQAGASGYIVKPFNAAMLKSKLVAILGDF